MKKIAAVLTAFAALTAGICIVPDAAVNALPATSVISPKTVSYARTLQSGGTLYYSEQADVTCSLPLVIKQFNVADGDTVEAGAVIATVDKAATQKMIESMGQINQLAGAYGITAAASLVPSEITTSRAGTVLSTAGGGTAVEAGGSICTIAGSNTLILTAPVSEQYISEVNTGDKVTFTLTAYPEESFTGTISAISPAARSKYSGAVLETVVDVTIVPDSHDPRMKSGLTADVCFTLTKPKNICVLPYEAIGQDEGGEYVYVYENGKAVRRKIFTGAEFSDGTEVIKGVSADELVLAKPDSISVNSFLRLE